jgi:hypothetical protein
VRDHQGRRREDLGVRHVPHHLGVDGRGDGRRVDRRPGRHDGAHRQLPDRVGAPLQQVGLALIARAEADQDQRLRSVAEVDAVDLAGQRRGVEHGAGAQHVGRVRHVGLELLRQRDDRARAGVVDVAESLDLRQTEPRAVRVRDRDARREHLDQGSAPEDRVRRVEKRRRRRARGQRDIDRGEQHAVDQHRVGRLPLQLLRDVPSDDRAEAELLDQQLHLGFEVVRIRHRVPERALAQRDEAGAQIAAPLDDRAVSEHPDLMAALDERAGDPQRRGEVSRAIPGDDQVAAHRAPSSVPADLTACKVL